MTIPTVILTSNASGAAKAAKIGYVVMVVDIIDMSTTAEALLDAGAIQIFGASPDNARPPVPVNPEQIGKMAALRAMQMNTDIVLVAEPRTGSDNERLKNIGRLVKGIKDAGAKIGAIIPNLGAETPRLCNVKGRIVIAATGTGGVAFDAAITAGASLVITGTVARTPYKKGKRPAFDAAERALKLARSHNTGIAVVAASSNSMEDIICAEYITRLIMEQW